MHSAPHPLQRVWYLLSPPSTNMPNQTPPTEGVAPDSDNVHQGTSTKTQARRLTQELVCHLHFCLLQGLKHQHGQVGCTVLLQRVGGLP